MFVKQEIDTKESELGGRFLKGDQQVGTRGSFFSFSPLVGLGSRFKPLAPAVPML